MNRTLGNVAADSICLLDKSHMMRQSDHDHRNCCYDYPGNHHAGVDVATVIASGVSETKAREQT